MTEGSALGFLGRDMDGVSVSRPRVATARFGRLLTFEGRVVGRRRVGGFEGCGCGGSPGAVTKLPGGVERF